MTFTYNALRQALERRAHPTIQSAQRAAVALVIRFVVPSEPHVLLMRRAECDGDRWSGQVSLPGGREQRNDHSLRATAVRETREELGVDLEESGEFVGTLDPQRAIAAGQQTDLMIFPFVFVETTITELVLNHEAERAFWLPLRLAESGTLDQPYAYYRNELRVLLPSWSYDGDVIWGLTHGILSQFLRTLSGPT